MEELASEEMEGRLAGNAGERAAARYLYDALRDAGVLMLTDSLGQDFSISTSEGELHSQNIVGIVQGCDPQLREEYVVVGARYDHLGTHTLTVDGEPVVQLYPGADCNASGVAILIELARMVSQYHGLFGRSVIFVGFGAGEQGMAGAWYFANRAFDEMGMVAAMIDLDCLGRSGEGHSFRYFSPLKSIDMNYLLNKTAEQPVVAVPVRSDGVQLSSEYLAFHERGVPVFLFTSGAAREHRTIRDLPYQLDYAAMEARCHYLYHFLQIVCSEDQISTAVQDLRHRDAPERVYAASDCDVRPQFFHSDEKHFLRSWVYKYLRYPSYAVHNKIQGQVLVSFVVEKDGSVTNVTVEHGVEEGLDEEAVRVVSVSPKWIPGQIKGEKVRTKIVLPVEFRLSSKWEIGLKK